MPDELDSAIDARRDEMLQLLCELIAAKTENPPGNEKPAAQIVQRFLDATGIGYDCYEKEPNRTNVVATIGAGEPSLLVACHLDVVPAGEGWRTDPFDAHIDGDRLYGRGSADNKGQLAACMVAAQCLNAHAADLKGRLILAAVADEEAGSALGLDYLMDECGLRADSAIIPDILHNMDIIDVAEKGVLWVRVTSIGKQAHGSTPEQGVNAVWNMVDFLNRLRQSPLPAVTHPYLTPATMNLGAIAGGTVPNMVPAKCEATLDIRHPPGHSKDDILAQLQQVIDDTVAANSAAQFKLEVMTELAPSEVPTDLPIIPLIQRHAQAVLGRRPRLQGPTGATVTKQLIERGIPAVGFSPGDNEAPHTANEFVSIQELVDFAKIMARISLDYLG